MSIQIPKLLDKSMNCIAFFNWKLYIKERVRIVNISGGHSNSFLEIKFDQSIIVK